MPRRSGRRLVVAMAVALLASACSGDGELEADESKGIGSTPAPVVSGSPGVADSTPSRLVSGEPSSVASDQTVSAPEQFVTVHLSEGSGSGSQSLPVVSRVDGDPLDDEEVSSLIDRLPPWDEGDSGRVAFNRPVETRPPPRTGDTIDRPFPAGPDIEAPVVDSGPLEVLRVQPVGEVGIAPFVSITFNQPMVPLATIDQLEEIDIPVEMSPSLPGRWQWIGTRTLRFEHDPEILDRLPMATTYVALRNQAGTSG